MLFAVIAAPLEKKRNFIPPCPGLPPDAAGLDVKMIPDPFVPGQEETFDIKGTMKNDIVTGDLLGIAFINLAEKHPIGAGTAFSTTQEYITPGVKELPKSYAIVIAIEHGNLPDIVTLAYSAAIFGASEPPAVPADFLDLWGFLCA
ncbi:hypothetical protein C1646_672217 [Rhizophagus diaphanus]|nr:hypothetical protein C1646_672217 [Rhizophagus diaphanus] [Rhizophagus sp. MUCL 43196]